MKMMEAQKITDFIMTDDWHNISENYDHSENGIFFVIEFNHEARRVTVHGPGMPKVYMWKGTKDHMTRSFRDWLHKIVNTEIEKAKEV